MKKSSLLTWGIVVLGIAAMIVLVLPAVTMKVGDSYSIYDLTFSAHNARGGLITAWVFLLISLVISIFVALLANVLHTKAGAGYLAILNVPFYITTCVLYSCTYVFANKGPISTLGLGAILAIAITGVAIVALVLAVGVLFKEANEEAK